MNDTRDLSAIRAGIEQARTEIEQSVADLRLEVAQTLDWRRAVRRRPEAWFAGAVVAGILVARWSAR